MKEIKCVFNFNFPSYFLTLCVCVCVCVCVYVAVCTISFNQLMCDREVGVDELYSGKGRECSKTTRHLSSSNKYVH